MVCEGTLLFDPTLALRRVLEATQALEHALAPLDVAAFERALAARAQALEFLAAQAHQIQGVMPPESVRELADAAAAADSRVRGQAALTLAGLREALRSLDNGRQGLVGYRPSAPNLARFSDRRG